MAFRKHANMFWSFTEGFMTKKECPHLLQLSPMSQEENFIRFFHCCFSVHLNLKIKTKGRDSTVFCGLQKQEVITVVFY